MKEYGLEMIRVGKRIRNIREIRGYTRDYLAEKSEISSKYLYEIETSGKDFSARILYRLAKNLNVSMKYIMVGECETEFISDSKLKLLKIIEEYEL